MNRQKLKGSQFSSGNRRPGYSIDGISRPVQASRPTSRFNDRRPTLVREPSAPYPAKPSYAPAQAPEFNQPDTTRPVLTVSPPPAGQQSAAAVQNQSLIGSNQPPNAFSTNRHSAAKPKSKIRRVLKPALIGLMVAVLGFGIWFGTSIIGSINKVFHGNVFSDAHALISGAPLKESGGRINILLAGDSADDPNHQGASLADSIMVISYSPSSKSGFILSVPRDLWVNIPSMGHQKINAANDVANFSAPGLPSGGMGQLQQIVQNDLGIPIDYEALIDYTAFKDAVNTVGGITIDIQSPDPRGIYDAYTHLKLPNGEVTLSGQEALDLARARGDNIAGDISYGLPNSDFDRTEHQRQMLEALFKKALSVGVLSNPIKIASLFSSFSNNVQTNLSLGSVISLIHLTGGLNLSRLQSVTYSYGGSNALLTNYLAPNGQEALIPAPGVDDFTQIKAYYQQLTSANPIAQEAPSITLLNASDVSGLAAREKVVLEAQGFNVLSIADTTRNYPTSLIVDNSNGQKPAASAQLAKDIKGQTVTSASSSTESEEAANYSSNYVVIMGQDWDSTPAGGNPIQN